MVHFDDQEWDAWEAQQNLRAQIDVLIEPNLFHGHAGLIEAAERRFCRLLAAIREARRGE